MTISRKLTEAQPDEVIKLTLTKGEQEKWTPFKTSTFSSQKLLEQAKTIALLDKHITAAANLLRQTKNRTEPSKSA